MRLIKSLYGVIRKITVKSANDCISAFSGEVTLFTIISFFPFMMMVLILLPYTPLTSQMVLNVINRLFSMGDSSIFRPIIDDVFSRNDGAVMSISIITLIWSASRGFLSIVYGLNRIYDAKESRGYLFLRFSALIYTIGFAGMIVMTLVLLVFGNQLFNWIIRKVPSIGSIAVLIISVRATVILSILLLFFIIIYVVVPNRKSSLIYELPGALIASAGWFGFSYLYSFYVDNFNQSSYMYGSLSTIVFLMIWLYFCMYIFFLGAELNSCIRSSIKRLQDRDRAKHQARHQAKAKAIE